MSTAKQHVESLLHKLPENCSLEDIQYHRYVPRQSASRPGRRQAAKEDDVENRLSQWLT
jgi:hypothetical protein